MFKKVGNKLVGVALGAAVALGFVLVPAGETGHAQGENIHVQLLGVNDLHGFYTSTYTEMVDGVETEIGRMDYLATHIKNREAENPNTLLVHSGDMIGGSPLVSAAFQDEPIVEVMNAMGFDFGTAGNHEFDEGIAEYLRMVNGGAHPEGKGSEDYTGMDFPNVLANAIDSSTGELLLEPYAVTEIEGQKVGFIGVATTETPSIVVRQGNENLEVTDEVEAINKYTEELKEQGVKSIIVLAHNPVNQDGEGGEGSADEIARNIDAEVDIILAGHNHREVNRTVNDILIVQAYEYGKAFVDVDFEIDPATGDIVSKEAEVVTNVQEGIEADPEITAIIDKYEAQVEDVRAQYAGDAPFTITGGYGSRGPIGDNGLGNLIADGMAWEMDADFAMMNGGGIRESLYEGEITYGDLFDIQPFGNTLTKFTIKGEDLVTVLNTQLSDEYGPDFSISGFTYTWNGDSNTIDTVYDLDGNPLNLDEEYTVVVNNYMYGREAHRMEEFTIGQPEIGPVDVDASFDYIQSFDGPVEAYAEGRYQEVKSIFNDVPTSHWANPFVTDLYASDIVKGTTATTFSPGNSLTRAQFASMLVRSLELEAEGTSPFEDTTGLAAETQDEITAAFENGLIKGTSATTFQPNQEITRGQMVTMLKRAFELETGEQFVVSDNDMFTDLGNLDEETRAAVQWASDYGIVMGYDELFKPWATATRAQSSKVLSINNYLIR
ncbi:2',3'-cyclic-nucleotide 2'-phosphodiesterase [Jeotgalibacillus alimentarius]|uniref:2',3'-cyclic-nucleotide 2'-phosphodiesterase n=1 Tax=Jeotgalibacillus alimentarius TaxID=135826 RepID=A0A0C2VRT8_9BACL|nr:5'-nucleotidase C-terminal domain-containing protein [Jeotgalibacillus alimentarius]KIL46713.1 2',3'-cyclic-nucleotide 2'-phosphodiesterase [Jeotgalibacillus alimentarius]